MTTWLLTFGLTFGVLAACSPTEDRNAEPEATGAPDDGLTVLVATEPPENWALMPILDEVAVPGRPESRVQVRVDAETNAGGSVLWEDGHRWSVGVVGAQGHVALLFADKFVPQGSVMLHVVEGDDTFITLLVESGTAGLEFHRFRLHPDGWVAETPVLVEGRMVHRPSDPE